MSVTFSAMANIASQTAQNYGLAQANSQGLGQTEANALAVTNLMGGSGSGESSPMTKQEFGASVVTQTISKLGSGGSGGSGGGLSMDFQMKVLGAGLTGKGNNINIMA